MPTDQENARYNVYRLVMMLAGLVPRGFPDWLVTYHVMGRRWKRRERLSKRTEKEPQS